MKMSRKLCKPGNHKWVYLHSYGKKCSKCGVVDEYHEAWRLREPWEIAEAEYWEKKGK